MVTTEGCKVSYSFKNYSETSETCNAVIYSKFRSNPEPILILDDVKFYQVMDIVKAMKHETQACRQSVISEFKIHIASFY
jgi:hypothetical protein